MNIIKEAFNSLKKNKFTTIVTVVILAFNILLLSIFAVFMFNLNSFLEEVKNNVELTVFLKDGVKKEVADSVAIKIKLKTGIADAIFVSRDDAIKELGESEDFKGYLTSFKINPLPDSIRVVFSREFRRNSEKLKETADFCKQLDGVADVYYQKEEMEKFFSLAGVLKKIILWLSVILFVGSVLIVSGTIRVSIFARKEDLKKLRSEGASWSSLKAIFVLESMLQGFVGGILATLLLFMLERAALDKLNILWSGKWQQLNLLTSIFVVFVGILLGFLSALFFRIKNYTEK